MDLVPDSPTNLLTLADRLKVLAEPKRLLILHLLMEGVQCNCELGGALEMPPNLISHHLSVLRCDIRMSYLTSNIRWIYFDSH